MAAPRVYADFHKLDDQSRLKLICIGTIEDLQSQQIQLREGLALTFYTDDADDEGRPDELRIDGIVQYNSDEQCWVAAVDWDRLRNASDEVDVPPALAEGNPADIKIPNPHA